MNGLSTSVNLEPLENAELIQICIGAFHAIMKFDIDAEISIESQCIYISPAGHQIRIDDFPSNAAMLCSMLGSKVRDATREGAGGLQLNLSDNARLLILNSNAEYESFQLRIGEETYIA